MARTKTVEELQAEQERIEKELKIKTQKLKALQQQEKEQLRKERTHRLCTHGAMLEQYLPPEEYSDKQIDEFFRTLFQLPEVVNILQWIKEQTDEQPETGEVPFCERAQLYTPLTDVSLRSPRAPGRRSRLQALHVPSVTGDLAVPLRRQSLLPLGRTCFMRLS